MTFQRRKPGGAEADLAERLHHISDGEHATTEFHRVAALTGLLSDISKRGWHLETQKGNGPAIPERCDWNIVSSVDWFSDGSSHGELRVGGVILTRINQNALINQSDLGKTVAVERHDSNGSQSESRVSSKKKSADGG